MHTITVESTRTVSERLARKSQLNDVDSLFGAEIFHVLDIAGGISVYKALGQRCFAASIDRMNFIRPIYDNEIYRAESIVTGIGNTSLEVYATAHVLEGSDYTLAAEAFITFVVEKPEDLPKEGNPKLIATTPQHQYLLEGYEERKNTTKMARAEQKRRMAILEE